MRLVALGLTVVLATPAMINAQAVGAYHDDRGIHVPVAETAPKLLNASTAACPIGAEHLKHVVTLRASIDADGAVTDVKLISAKSSIVDTAAIEAVKHSTFTRGTVNGNPTLKHRLIWVAFRGDGSPGVLLDPVERAPVPLSSPQALSTDLARKNHFGAK